jgi:predicted O-methyltransferase YrrM
MSEPTYTLQSSILSYEYPKHMIRHENSFYHFFDKFIPQWEQILDPIRGKDNIVGIEIGSFNGDFSVWCAERVVNGKDSVLYTIDPNQGDWLKNNIAPYSNIQFKQGLSEDVLRNLTHNGQTKEFADFVFVDGSHFAIDAMRDAVLGWHLLKPSGLMVWDDTLWGAHVKDHPDRDILTPKSGVEAFMAVYRKHYEIVAMGWQVFLRKTPYTYPTEEMGANYRT